MCSDDPVPRQALGVTSLVHLFTRPVPLPVARRLPAPDHRHIRPDGAGSRHLCTRPADGGCVRRGHQGVCGALALAGEHQVVARRPGQDRHPREAGRAAVCHCRGGQGSGEGGLSVPSGPVLCSSTLPSHLRPQVILMARLFTKGKDYGPHAFVVQARPGPALPLLQGCMARAPSPAGSTSRGCLSSCGWPLAHCRLPLLGSPSASCRRSLPQIRDLDTHLPLPGIMVGDIGPKMGCALGAQRDLDWLAGHT